MISLYDGELVDILPDELKKQPEYAAISYAIRKVWQRLHQYAVKVSVFACIDDLTEDMLDLLAIEMRAQYYEQSFPADIKRNIIRQSIIWNMKAGTKYAVDNAIRTIYGDGEAIEWYDYDGTPGHFKIVLEALNTFDFTKIIEVLDKIKRKTARLDGIDMIMRSEQKLYYGTISAFNTEVELTMAPVKIEDTWFVDHAGNMLIDPDGNVLIE